MEMILRLPREISSPYESKNREIRKKAFKSFTRSMIV